MTDYCQFTIQSLMGCYKNVTGLKKVIAFKKSICLKIITGDQSKKLYSSKRIVFLKKEKHNMLYSVKNRKQNFNLSMS